MKKILGILMMVIAMMTVTTNVCAQAPNQKQRLSREQLAEKQAQYIAHDLGLDEKTSSKFIDTYAECQKEVWALGPRLHHKKGEVKTDAQTEQEILDGENRRGSGVTLSESVDLPDTRYEFGNMLNLLIIRQTFI